MQIHANGVLMNQSPTMKGTIAIILSVLPLLLLHDGSLFVFRTAIPHSNATAIFKYLTSASNLPALNPTITRLKVVFGNETQLVVAYEELLHQMPMMRNLNLGRYSMESYSAGRYLIQSRHLTCFLRNIYCLPTEARIHLAPTEDGKVSYEEEIRFKCPWIGRKFCLEEILNQRMSIVDHLKLIFGCSRVFK